MGQARLKRLQSQGRLEQVKPAAERVGAAIRKMAEAASTNLGFDCYMHAAIGQQLLKDLGVETELIAGHACWRIGYGDGDVIVHADGVQGYLPEGAQGVVFHVWLETIEDGAGSPILIDLTTYQLRLKAKQLDEADGGHTQVEWCPNLLILPRNEIHKFIEVRQASGPGLSYYRPVAGMLERLNQGMDFDPVDLQIARRIMQTPDINVMGVNQFGFEEEEPIRYRPVA